MRQRIIPNVAVQVERLGIVQLVVFGEERATAGAPDRERTVRRAFSCSQGSLHPVVGPFSTFLRMVYAPPIEKNAQSEGAWIVFEDGLPFVSCPRRTEPGLDEGASPRFQPGRTPYAKDLRDCPVGRRALYLLAPARLLPVGDLSGVSGTGPAPRLLPALPSHRSDPGQCVLPQEAGDLRLVQSPSPSRRGLPVAAVLAATQCDRAHRELHAQVRSWTVPRFSLTLAAVFKLAQGHVLRGQGHFPGQTHCSLRDDFVWKGHGFSRALSKLFRAAMRNPNACALRSKHAPLLPRPWRRYPLRPRTASLAWASPPAGTSGTSALAAPMFSRLRSSPSILAKTARFSLRKERVFSRPWPMRSPS